MTITAKVIADSVSPDNIRLTTMQLRYPRFIHAEELTHRILSTTPEEIIYQKIADGLMYDENLSRNASSSRAIPVNRLIQDVLDDTAMPIHWGKNQKGMQADEENSALVELAGKVGADPKAAWLEARDNAIRIARAFDAAGYHKQIVNRLLEPFSHINVVVTATNWSNFFALRDHKDAQPEIRKLAIAMQDAMRYSIVHRLQPGQWHLPFVVNDDWPLVGDSLIKLSVARCARVSYLTHDGKKPDVASDLELYDRLVGSAPLHASPAEHQATPDKGGMCVDASNGPDKRKPFWQWNNPKLHGNFEGWIQFRKTLPNERQ